MRTFAVTAGTVAAVVAALAQSPQPPRPTFRTEANFVRVDVYPARDGKPVDDLTAADFEVLEDGALQSVRTFEHIVVPLPGPQTARIEPNSVRESQAMATDARARVFVVFLDTVHVNFTGSHQIRQPLVNLLDRLIGQDDLVAVMTPEMSASEITFARRTLTTEGMLARYWTWGRRDSAADKDPTEFKYEDCYDPATAADMIRRRREKRTLDALTNLVVHLRGIREERKAVIAITGGWTLPRRDERLMPKPQQGTILGLPPIGVDSTGRIVTRDPTNISGNRHECDRDRMLLAQLDLQREFFDLLDTANRSNASFYPVNPGGLEAAATVGGIDWIKTRVDSLRTLAENTDGVVVVDSNDLNRGMARIVSDLSSYYLLGYYSSNPRLDGTFRKITVRVKRPAVSVRARRGYLAATAAEVSAGREAVAAAPRMDEGVSAALGVLSGVDRATTLRLAAGQSFDTRNAWVIGELDSRAFADWRGGGEAMILITQPNSETVAQSRASIAAGRRTFMSRLDLPDVAPGTYNVQVRATAAGVRPVLETTRLQISRSKIGTPLLFRRGPLTSQPFEPTADPRYRRHETLRVQTASGLAISNEIRFALLDRSGRSMTLPLAIQELHPDGEHWIAGDLALASLATGDYVIQIEVAGEKSLVAFRVVP